MACAALGPSAGAPEGVVVARKLGQQSGKVRRIEARQPRRHRCYCAALQRQALQHRHWGLREPKASKSLLMSLPSVACLSRLLHALKRQRLTSSARVHRHCCY